MVRGRGSVTVDRRVRAGSTLTAAPRTGPALSRPLTDPERRGLEHPPLLFINRGCLALSLILQNNTALELLLLRIESYQSQTGYEHCPNEPKKLKVQFCSITVNIIKSNLNPRIPWIIDVVVPNYRTCEQNF